MAAWLTVYCTRSVRKVTAAELRKVIDDADIHTIAEGFGIDDEDVVDRALSQFSIEPVTRQAGVKFSLRYRHARYRPVLIHLWVKAARVKTEREEALEQFDGIRGAGAGSVRRHLSRVIEVVAVELGWNQLEDMGVVLGGQVAEYFASVGAGLIRDQNDDWWTVKNRITALLVGRGDEP
jgi:hypothetical protein